MHTHLWKRRRCAVIRMSWTDTPATSCRHLWHPTWLCGRAEWCLDSWRNWTLGKTPTTCLHWSSPNLGRNRHWYLHLHLHRSQRRLPCSWMPSSVPCWKRRIDDLYSSIVKGWKYLWFRRKWSVATIVNYSSIIIYRNTMTRMWTLIVIGTQNNYKLKMYRK